MHEWFHNLGAVHHAEREMLLHPSYAHQQRALDVENAEVIALALRARVRAQGKPVAPDYADLAAYLATIQPDGWYRADREQLVALVGPPGAGAAPAAAAPVAASVSLPAPARVPAATATVTGALDPAATPASLQALRAAVDEGRWEAAIDGCTGAPRTPPPPAALWSAHLAELCARSGMITRAEERLMGALGEPEEAPARQAIARARLHHGVPPGHSALSASDEAARAKLWQKARAALDAGKLDEAQSALRPAVDRFGEDAGFLALRCEVAVRRSPTGQDPGGSCERAISAWDQQPRALFWSAMAQANDGHRPVAVMRLQRATKVDPTLEGPWRMLADIYRIEGRRDQLKALRAEYLTRFGKPLR
jgi:tetratricopeptide (TPR) repeat protein